MIGNLSTNEVFIILRALGTERETRESEMRCTADMDIISGNTDAIKEIDALMKKVREAYYESEQNEIKK